MAEDAGISLDDYQRQAMTSTAQTLLLNWSRQAGKSQTTALIVLHQLICFPDSTCVIVGPSERQAKESMLYIFRFYRLLGRPVRWLTVAKTELSLANGSRVLAFPGGSPNTIRGVPNVSILVMEEASLIPDETRNALSPVLAVSGGRMICPFTPQSQNGWLWDLWADEEDQDIERITISADQVPRITAAFLEREHRRLPEYRFHAEYYNTFFDNIQSAFRSEDIRAAVQEEMEYDYELSSLLVG